MKARLIHSFPLIFSLLTPLVCGAQTGPVVVGVDAVKREALSRTVTVIGRLVSRQRGVVAANTRGRVGEVRVQVGERVEKGDVLAILDRDRLAWWRDQARSEVTEAQANLANAQARVNRINARMVTAQARLALAEQELARFEKLRGSVAFSPANYDDKRLEVEVARRVVEEVGAEVDEALTVTDQFAARLTRARITLELAADELDDAEVRAPYPGVVTSRQTEAGAYLNLGDPVVSLLNDQDLEIEADVPFKRLAGVPSGARVRFSLDEAEVFDALVRAIGAEENPQTRTRVVRFQPLFDKPRRSLAEGQSVTLILPAGPAREIVSVHKDAVIRQAGSAIVFIVTGSAAEIRPVTLGDSNGVRFEVLHGLEAGDLVVVRGNERLQPGQAVAYESPP